MGKMKKLFKFEKKRLQIWVNHTLARRKILAVLRKRFYLSQERAEYENNFIQISYSYDAKCHSDISGRQDLTYLLLNHVFHFISIYLNS